MNFNIKENNGLVSLSELNDGDLFMYDDEISMVVSDDRDTVKIPSDSGFPIITVNIKTGILDRFRCDSKVRKIEKYNLDIGV